MRPGSSMSADSPTGMSRADYAAALRTRLAQFAAFNQWERDSRRATEGSTPADRVRWAGEALEFAERMRPIPEPAWDANEIQRRIEIRRRLTKLDEYLRERSGISRRADR